MRFIINGRAGAGKDVIADYMVEEYGFTKITFADGIYEIARNTFGMTTKDRKLLQTIGQKMREIDPDVWIKHVEQKVKQLGYDSNIVISDCRQSNEYDIMVHEHNFIPIRVAADKEIRRDRIRLRDGVDPDMSLLETKGETGADNKEYKYEVLNESSKTDLYNIIDSIITSEM